MKKMYYETNLSYLFPGMIVAVVLYYELTDIDMMIKCIVYMLYSTVFVWSIIETLISRKDFDEVIENGRLVTARVKRLQKVSCEYRWGKGGGMYIHCYQIEAQYLEHTYISAPVLKRYRKQIPEQVKIYSYMGKDCFVWERSEKKIDFDIVEGETWKGKWNRAILNLFIVLWGIQVLFICLLVLAERLISGLGIS